MFEASIAVQYSAPYNQLGWPTVYHSIRHVQWITDPALFRYGAQLGFEVW